MFCSHSDCAQGDAEQVGELNGVKIRVAGGTFDLCHALYSAVLQTPRLARAPPEKFLPLRHPTDRWRAPFIATTQRQPSEFSPLNRRIGLSTSRRRLNVCAAAEI